MTIRSILTLSLTARSSKVFFHVDINQSEVEDRFQLAPDWVKSVQKNVNKSKVVTLSGSLL